ncbi:SH2 domain-containing protein 7 [Podarcis muralis]
MEASLEIENQPSEMLRDLVLRWFLQAQVPLMLQDGSLPEWFHGFITRKQTEEQLKEKSFGSFLIRLNERSFGYILSYRGKDRCRHFVISCQRNGCYVISGDTQTHPSLAELISYYQTSKIEPFGENLTMACPNQEERSIYDEISVHQPRAFQQSSASTISELTREVSGSSPASRPAKEDSSPQPVTPRKKLQEQQESLSRENRKLSPEQDPEAAPLVPDKSCLLMAETFEEDFGTEGSIAYSAVKKHPLDNRSLEVPKYMCKVLVDSLPKPEEPGQVSASPYKKKTSTVFALTKQSDSLYGKKVTENSHPETTYSIISRDQDKSCLAFPAPTSGPSSVATPKKAMLSPPASAPPKLSPKLPNKPVTSSELWGSQSPFAAYASSLVFEKEPQEPNHPQSLPDLPRGNMHGQIIKMKHPKSTAPLHGDDLDEASNTYEQIPFTWSKGITHDPNSEKLLQSSLIQPKETYDQISVKTGRSSKAQVYTVNPCKKSPDPFSKAFSSKRNVFTAENTYEQIHFSPGKEAECKASQKSDKPRRFLFAEKKTKF